MSPKPYRPEALTGKVFQSRTAVGQRLITYQSLRSMAWRRLFRGVYADRALADTHRLRCHAAAAFLLPKGAIIAGRSAATLYGVGFAEATDPVEVVVPATQRFGPVQGLLIHTGDVSADDIRMLGGLAVTDPVRTCWDLAQWLDTAEAVVLIDRLLAAGLVRRSELESYASMRKGDRGWRRFSRAIGLADSRAGSPQESRLRVRLSLRGLAAPEVQYPVYGPRGFVARVDLAWPELKIAIEYDGAWHAGTQRQIDYDRKRLNRLIASGWIVIHVTAARLRDDFVGIVADIRAAMRLRKAA